MIHSAVKTGAIVSLIGLSLVLFSFGIGYRLLVGKPSKYGGRR